MAENERNTAGRVLDLTERLSIAQKTIKETREAIAVKQVYLDGWLREEKRICDELNALTGVETAKPLDPLGT